MHRLGAHGAIVEALECGLRLGLGLGLGLGLDGGGGGIGCLPSSGEVGAELGGVVIVEVWSGAWVAEDEAET